MSLDLVQHRLQVSGTLAGVQAAAAAEACDFCGFDRAVVLAVRDRGLAPQAELAVAHAESDALRLRALAASLVLVPDSDEAELIRRREGLGPDRPGRVSVLREPLELQHHLVVPIMPEAR